MGVLDLPTPNTSRLAHSPLTLVACQVRHERILAVSDARIGLRIHEALSPRYPTIHEVTRVETAVQISPTGASATREPAVNGWQLKSGDQRWTVTIDPESFTLETSAYDDWDDFQQRFSTLTAAVLEVYQPTLEQRIGLRYVDEIRDSSVTSPSGWRGKIADSILGPIADARLGGAVRSSQQLLELDAGDSCGIVLRHGAVTSPTGAEHVYLLDHDCFRQAGRPLSTGEIAATVERLHELALQVFQAAVTPEFYAQLSNK
jgi:uncharacterized protein (TIGR04255 family)